MSKDKDKKKKLYNNKIALKILVPFIIAALLIATIGTYLIYHTTQLLSEDAAHVKLCDLLESYTDYMLQADLDGNWYEIDKEVFYWDWENDDYSQEFLHASDFGFAALTYNQSTGCYEVETDLNSGINRILAYDDSVLKYENCQELYENGSIYYTTVEMKEGILNKYYWLIVTQSKETMRPGMARRAFAVVYNVTESTAMLKKFYLTEMGLMIGPALLFTAIIGLVVGIMTKRIHKASEYVANIDPESLPEEPLHIHSNDELEEMADSVNRMVSGLKERDRMAGELSIAAKIQRNMLIRKFPAFPDHKEFDIYAIMDPAKEVGGDFYDMFMVDDKHLAILIADVSDKGVPAALFMAMAKSLIKYHLMHNNQAEVLKSVNSFLNEGNKKYMFVTCFLGVLNIETGELEYTNAGHNPPIIKKGKDGEYEYLDVKRNIVLAINSDSTYESQKIVLPHGSKILLYTDGVTEAVNVNEEQYEEERLIACLKEHDDKSVDKVLPAIMQNINDFCGEQPQFDDITMLMLEYF